MQEMKTLYKTNHISSYRTLYILIVIHTVHRPHIHSRYTGRRNPKGTGSEKKDVEPPPEHTAKFPLSNEREYGLFSVYS